MPINVNKQIEEAMERGEFANLPGKGKPLKFDSIFGCDKKSTTLN